MENLSNSINRSLTLFLSVLTQNFIFDQYKKLRKSKHLYIFIVLYVYICLQQEIDGLFQKIYVANNMVYQNFNKALLAKANGRRPVGRLRTGWTNYIESLGWNRLGLHPSEMMNVIEDREVWRFNLELLHPQPSRKRVQ